MPQPASERPPDPGPAMRIGQLAELTGVTTRALRYYEELGLIAPEAREVPTQSRRYPAAEARRVRRIKELQEVLGADLGEIRDALQAEDRLEGLRTVYRRSTSPAAQAVVLSEAVTLVERQLAQVEERQRRLELLRLELEERRHRHLSKLAALRGGDAPPMEAAAKA
ncbi:MAG: MerR family transcriptional regulator [Candidatus Dormibacteria bacterium]